jgi:cysteine dioxygenase
MRNLKTLISFIKNKPILHLKTLTPILNSYQCKDWVNYEFYDIDKYKKNLVYRNEDFEIFVVCWSQKQGTVIHDHADNGCILKVLQGELIEYKYDPKSLKLKESYNLPTGSVSYIDNNCSYHKIINNSSINTVSLHIYSPPNYQGKTYQEST